MANENGTWIMYGVDWNDPECLHTVRDGDLRQAGAFDKRSGFNAGHLLRNNQVGQACASAEQMISYAINSIRKINLRQARAAVKSA